MQRPRSYRTNRDLFSNHYLDEHLPETEAWRTVDESEVREAYESISTLFEDQADQVESFNEHQLERHLIRPVFNRLDLAWETEEAVHGGGRRPDYAFFKDDEDRQHAFTVRDEGEDFYRNAIAVGDAKRWGRPLDKRSGHEEEFSNPSFQIHIYLQQTPPDWGVLTNGKQWRLYYAPSSYQFDSYYEIDLPTVLDEGDLEAFRYFYLFFRRQAFVEDSAGRSFLDRVHEGSNAFAQELGDDLRENIYEAIGVLAEGFIQYEDNLSAEDLDLIHDASLTYLYRLIFVLYAESEGRHLLDTREDTYRERYSVTTLKREVCEALDENEDFYPWETRLWDRLDRLFTLIDRGSENHGIDPNQLYIPAYDGGLFKTHDIDDASREARFLQDYSVGDEHLSEVIDLLTRRKAEDGSGMAFVDYSSLGVRHLGSIYEGLLEYQLNVAEAPMVAVRTDGGQEWRTRAEADSDAIVEGTAIDEGDVYLTTDTGERKATGSYYTPEYVVQYIIKETLDPLVEEIRADLLDGADENFAEAFADRVFDLRILDPAMGSGHFLVDAVDYLAKEIIEAQEQQQDDESAAPVDEPHDIHWARRQIAQRCIYGVDLNPMATELAKVSLWLRTLAAEQPLAFLDHHLKTGNSLVGSDIEDVLENGDGADDAEDDQLTLTQSFDRTRRQALDHVTDRFQALLAIDNETLADVREMEAVFNEVRTDPLYKHLLAMANVHTADEFGLDVPSDAYERMAAALRDDSWAGIEGQDWFQSAQALAAEERFFHWELEFPVAFYGDDGERDEDVGFDAVIGNPPYVFIDSIPEIYRDYFRSISQTWDYRYDLYGLFTEFGLKLTRDSGHFGYIIPHSILNNNSFGDLRKYLLDNSNFIDVIDFSESVFRDAANETMILKIQNSANSDKSVLRGAHIAIDELGDVDDKLASFPASAIEKLPGSPFVVRGSSWVWKLIESPFTVPMGDLTEAVQGLRTGNNKERLSDKKEGSDYRKALGGEDIDRYSYEWSDTWVLYDRELLSQDSAARPREEKYWEAERKILVQEIRNVHLPKRLVAAIDEERFIGLNTTNAVITDHDSISLDYVMGFLSSSLINEFFRCCFVDNHIATQYLEAIPVYEVDPTDGEISERLDDALMHAKQTFDVEETESYLDDRTVADESDFAIHETISSLVTVLTQAHKEHNALNLNLLDYLGNYIEGPKLPDIGRFQPTSPDLLDATTEDHEKLNIGEVRTERDGSSVTIYATARYKLEEEAEHETDRWGYTETDYLEAFTLSDLSETEATLVEAFVPVAVEEGDGFAGFRDNATKTTSLVDRLKAMTLPDPDDVADDLRRYVETKERADELDEKIEKTDQLIDEIVYELYGLTDEEIEIVEEAVSD